MEFSIKVESLDDAIVLIENMYRKEEIVLDYSDFDRRI